MISSATANPILQALFIQFMQDAKEFVAADLFPFFFTPQQSANYYVLSSSNMLNVPRDISRSPTGNYSRSRSVLADATFSCKEYGHEEPVSDRERKKYQSYLDLDSTAIKRLVRINLVNRELRAQAKAAALTGVNPTALWDDFSSSNPILDVDAGRESIHNSTGMDPNLLIVPRGVFNKLKEHPIVRDHYKFVDSGSITEEMLAALFRINKLVVAGGIQNNANEGQTTSPAQIWGKDVILALTDSSQDMTAPSYGRTFAWTQDTGPDGILLESYRDDSIRGDVHRFRTDLDEVSQLTGAAYRLASVIS